jgi:hypothetical protein
MGEITYQGEPPYLLPMTRPALVRAVRGSVEMTAFASVHGKGRADFPIRIPMALEEARQLITDLRTAVITAEQQLRAR